MATRVNIMKLLQEMRGMSEITRERPQARQPGPLLLSPRSFGRRKPAKSKRMLPIAIQNRPDIPDPVRITYRTPAVQANAAPLT